MISVDAVRTIPRRAHTIQGLPAPFSRPRTSTLMVQARYEFVVLAERVDGTDIRPLPCDTLAQAETRVAALRALGFLNPHIRMQKRRPSPFGDLK